MHGAPRPRALPHPSAFAGWRAAECEQKVTGVPYEDIAAAGGGIAASARAFAQAGDHPVLAQASTLAHEMPAWRTTTLECKSGYGLSIAAELRALRLAVVRDGEVVWLRGEEAWRLSR